MEDTMTSTATARPRTFTEAEQLLAAAFPHYQGRPHQQRLAAAIEQAIAGEGKLLAQAGCGVGKSYAGLIPAILSGRKTVVATATKALQDQYFTQDLPALQAVLAGVVDFTFTNLKGRSNYLCVARASELQDPTPAQLELVEALEAAGENATGDKDTLPAVTGLEWSKLSISAAECPGKHDCPFSDRCWAEKAKARAAAADIIVTNLAYLMQDLKLRLISNGTVSLLGEYDIVIIDEGHELAEYATGALEDRFGQGTFIKLAKDFEGFMRRAGKSGAQEAAELAQAAGELFERAGERYSRWNAPRRQAEPLPLRSRDIVTDWQRLFVRLSDAVRDIYTELDRVFTERGGELHGARTRLLRRARNLAERTGDYVLAADTEIVRYVEAETEWVRRQQVTRHYFFSKPVSVAPFLRKVLWNTAEAGAEHPLPQPTVIVMSATLAVSGKFDYTRYQTGVQKGEAGEFDAGSPFDFATQALLYVPAASEPEPSGRSAAAWGTWSREVMQHLVLKSGGGALLLFTSRSGLDSAYSTLEPVFTRAGLKVLKQGEASPQALVRAFREDGNAVLFGLKTFMVGVDVPGRALRLVILDKLPFAVPSDLLVKAQNEAYERRFGYRRSFQGLTIPQMSLVLIQAFGRAIRSVSDQAVIAILDPRLQSKPYGSAILKSLPPAPVTSDAREAAQWAEEIAG
jgi:ATP-dependent DNA helicase DinG